MQTYVFSRTLGKIVEPGIELVAGDAVKFVRDLKRASGKDICLMGGGELAQSLLSAGLVDETGLNTSIRYYLAQGSPHFVTPVIE